MYTLLEDTADFVLVCKDHGVNFHKGTGPVGLVDQVRHDLHCADLLPVHRLDSMTSGLLLLARGRTAAREICSLFRERKINKMYLALGENHPKKKQGLIKGDMVKGRNGVWILSHSVKNPAVTRFVSYGMGNGLRLYLVKPYTGRTHQIRVALKSISAPVLGDQKYFKNKTGHNIDRGYLHAFALAFTLKGKEFRYVNVPSSGMHWNTEAFAAAFARMGDAWNIQWPAECISALPDLSAVTPGV